MAMWERDLERTNPTTGRLLTQLPEMRERYIYRDNWTRLNVKPAKIMQVICIVLYMFVHVCLYALWKLLELCIFFFYVQQDRVLEELAGHCAGTHTSSTDRDKQTLCYLQALNKLFERGILSDGKISSVQSEKLQSMKEGLSFFQEWCEDVTTQGTNPGKQSQTAFLSWQVRQAHSIKIFAYIISVTAWLFYPDLGSVTTHVSWLCWTM